MDRSRSRLTSQVFAKLRDEIVRGQLPPDTALSEADLCMRLDVSRTPVREALIKLAEEDLVIVYPHFGTFVAPISLHAVRVGQYVREHLECALVADAARRIDDRGRRQILDNIEEQANAIGDPEHFYGLDNHFHALIAELSGHAGVWAVILRAKTQFDRVRYLSVRDNERIVQILAEHRDIGEALVAGDGATAATKVRDHLRRVFASIDQLGLKDEPPRLPVRKKRLEAVAEDPLHRI